MIYSRECINVRANLHYTEKLIFEIYISGKKPSEELLNKYDKLVNDYNRLVPRNKIYQI